MRIVTKAVVIYLIVFWVAVLFMVFGCGGISSGTVVGKEYEPEQVSLSTYVIKVGDVMLPQTTTHVDDEDWFLVIEGRNDEGELKRSTVQVSREEYEFFNVGDYYARN